MESDRGSDPGPDDRAVDEPDIEPQPAGSYEWRYADEAGVSASGPGVAFDSQESAERWLAENYRELAEDNISAVSLFDGNGLVYGPMPLESQS